MGKFEDENSSFEDCPCDEDERNFHSSQSQQQNFFYFPGAHVNPLNPGNISNLHKKVRDLTPEWVEGLSLRMAKNLNVNSGIYAEWLMGNQIPVGARFGCAFGVRDKTNVTKTPMLTVDTNPNSLASNFHFLYHPIPEIKIESKFQTLPYPKFAHIKNSIAVLEYSEKQTTVSLNLFNLTPSNGKATFGILHSFTKQFCGGIELFMSWNANENQINEMSMAFAGRYSIKKNSIAATISRHALDISYWHQPKDYLQLGASFIYDQRSSKAVGSLGYQLDFEDAKVKGMIDTDFSVGCTYTAFLKNLSSTFGFSLLYCIPTQKFYCGLKYELNSNFQ